MPVDIDASLSFVAKLADELGAHVSGALDMRRSFSERQDSAFRACELIARTGALEKLQAAKRWIEGNRKHLEQALKLGRFVQDLRGR